MKVFCVFQASGSYDTYMNELKGVASTEQKAKELKEVLDKDVVTFENLYTIVPEDIFSSWPYDCEDEENDIWSPHNEYKGYSLDQFMVQCVSVILFHKLV